MIQVNKISNETDGFLISYYSDNGNKIIVVNEKNIVAELNKAFEDLTKIQLERAAREKAMQEKYKSGRAVGGCGETMGCGTLNSAADSITRAA
jgi:hypothetical protein